MAYEFLKVGVVDRVGWIEYQRPPLNSIDWKMLAADPPQVDGARDSARRTIRDGNRASEVIARLRALLIVDSVLDSPRDRAVAQITKRLQIVRGRA
jgi:hypothetical protein